MQYFACAETGSKLLCVVITVFILFEDSYLFNQRRSGVRKELKIVKADCERRFEELGREKRIQGTTRYSLTNNFLLTYLENGTRLVCNASQQVELDS